MIAYSARLFSLIIALLLLSPAAAQEKTESSDPYFKAEKKQTTANIGTPAMRTSANPVSSATPPERVEANSSQETAPVTAISNPSTTGSKTETPSKTLESFERTRVLARVGDQPIFVSDLSIEAMELVDKFMPTAPFNVKKREAAKLLPRLLPKYIQGKLLLVDAIEGLPEGADFEGILENAGEAFDENMIPKLLSNRNLNTRAELDAYYMNLGSSLRNVRRSWCENEIVMYTMRSKINNNPEVSHREIYDFYVANKAQYALPAKVRWEQLVVRFDKFPSKEAARKAISDMYDEVRYGAPLSAVAKRQSQGFKAQEGGQQGWTTKGSLVDKKLDALLFSIELDKLSDIIETSRGFVVVRAQERRQAGFVSFEEAQKEIKKKIGDEKLEAQFQAHLSKVKARVPVEIFEPEVIASNPQNPIR